MNLTGLIKTVIYDFDNGMGNPPHKGEPAVLLWQ
jgi:hypothetical protein